MTAASSAPRRLMLGSCPDSWGVWFADDPLQTPWTRFLDEVAEVGYQWLELGPFGYLPTDQRQLTEELGRRGLRVAGGTVHGFSGLHRPGDWPEDAQDQEKGSQYKKGFLYVHNFALFSAKLSNRLQT